MGKKNLFGVFTFCAFAVMMAFSCFCFAGCDSFGTVKGKCEYVLVENHYEVVGASPKNATKIKIDEKYKGLPVTAIADGAFSKNNDLKDVTIPNSIKTIGKEAFMDCNYLRKIKIPEGGYNYWR